MRAKHILCACLAAVLVMVSSAAIPAWAEEATEPAAEEVAAEEATTPAEETAGEDQENPGDAGPQKAARKGRALTEEEILLLVEELQRRQALGEALTEDELLFLEEHSSVEAPKQEEPPVEAPKQEEPPVEAPKQEEPPAETPEQEKPPAETPEQEETPAETPEQEETPVETPEQEEPPAETPKQEEPPAETPKQEEPPAETPKQEEPPAETPRQEEPPAETPKAEEAPVETPKAEEAPVETPKVKAPVWTAPKAEAPAWETPKGSGVVVEISEVEEPLAEAEPVSVELVQESLVIRVVVPDSGAVLVNPYQMKVTVEGMESTEQVISGTMLLTNHSNVPVQVNASVHGSVPEGSNAVFVASPPKENVAKKELFVYLEFRNSTSGTVPGGWDSQYRNAANQLLVTEKGSDKKGLLYLDAGDQEPAYGVFRLFGSVAGSPAEIWTAKDNIKITVAFTFVPLLEP